MKLDLQEDQLASLQQVNVGTLSSSAVERAVHFYFANLYYYFYAYIHTHLKYAVP